jgi:hypothetical protein
MSTETVFISYSSRDRREALEIKSLLESQSIKVWLDYFDIQEASDLRQELSDKVRQSDVFCLLLSPSASESRWVNEEIEYALAAAKAGLRILPIILRPCRVPSQLDNIVGVDVSEGLKREAVRLRLLRAIGGKAGGSDKLLLDAANRHLLADRETLQRAEQELPTIDEKVKAFVERPIRNVSVVIHPDTLPDDPDIILVLKLDIDNVHYGAMSFYIARYREARTWPADWELREPPYTDYFLQDRPRLDVQFVWFDRTVRLQPAISGMETQNPPPIFTLSFDGGRFKPKGNNPWQSFEVPSLAELEKEKSRFRLIAYDVSRKKTRELDTDTDVDIAVLTQADFDPELRVSGMQIPPLPLMRARSPHSHMCLYSSRTTMEQRLLLQSDFLQHISSPIRRSILLQQYAPVYDWSPRQEEIELALEKGEFETEEQRRLAARFRYNEAKFAEFKGQFETALNKYDATSDLLAPLIQGRRTPDLQDASLAYEAMKHIVDTTLTLHNVEMAGHLCNWMTENALHIALSDPNNADFQRILADAMSVSAQVHAKLGDRHRVAESLQMRVATQGKLFGELPSLERRNDFLATLVESVNSAQEWDVGGLLPIERWKKQLASELGEDRAERLTARKLNEMPRWLESSNPAGWPTQDLRNSTLQYSLRIPPSWATDPTVRGNSLEVEHLFRGKRAAEWLTVAFMEDADPDANIRDWIDGFIDRTGFPALVESRSEPSLRTWDYLGRLAVVAAKLKVDEAHAYTGLANYSDGGTPVLGRVYILLARRKRYAWKIALSFETACFDGMSDKRVYEQDHIRAGAILGSLRLGNDRRRLRVPRRPI